MNNFRPLSVSGGILVLLGILVLPIGGCGGEHINGIQAINSDVIPQNLKILIALAVLFGLAMMMLKDPLAAMTSSVFGIICLFLAHYFIYKAIAAIMMMIGSTVAVIGFAISWTANFLAYINRDE